MDILQLLTLALLQGFTEFLPISSSAHLILVPVVTGWPDQGLAFDVAVHVGTLAAVLLYFRREVLAITTATLTSLATRRLTPDAKLGWAVILGTIPVGLAGLLFKDAVETWLRAPWVIALATIGFGLLLWWADARARAERTEYSLSLSDCLLIGVAQAVALIPGTSRSGITMTAGLMLGLSREAAARFSFLLSIPVIILAGLLSVKDLLEQAAPVAWVDLGLGTLAAGISAYLCIHVFLALIARIGMLPFVIYRLLLGVGLLVLLY